MESNKIINGKIRGVDVDYMINIEYFPPFGKYSGKPLKTVLDNKSYCQWLLKMNNIKDFDFLYNILVYKYPEFEVKKEIRVPQIFEGMNKFK